MYDGTCGMYTNDYVVEHAEMLVSFSSISMSRVVGSTSSQARGELNADTNKAPASMALKILDY